MKSKRMRMTETEFFKLLPKNGWKIEKAGLRRNGVCPVCAVANKVLHKKRFTLEYATAAEALNLPESSALLIAAAADDPRWMQGRIASRLLKACGVAE